MSDDLNKLMEIAKKEIKDDKFKKLPPVRRFMMSDDVEHGDYPIPAMLIYDRYIKWCDAYKIKALSVVNFFKELALYCKKKKTNDGIFYMLSSKGFDLSPQYLQIVNSKKWISNGTKEKKVKEKHKNAKS